MEQATETQVLGVQVQNHQIRGKTAKIINSSNFFLLSGAGSIDAYHQFPYFYSPVDVMPKKRHRFQCSYLKFVYKINILQLISSPTNENFDYIRV